MNPLQILFGGDAVSKAVALALLLMSLSSWLIILWRGWLLRRFAQALPVAVDAFWCSPGVVEGAAKLARLDRLGLIANMVAAASSVGSQKDQGGAGYAIPERLRLTRVLRSGLRMAVRHLQWGQVWLATVGSTAPFVGLLGTVWSIYHAMQGLVGGAVPLDRIAGPVGESLVMTAAGLAVALPAAVAYNLLGRWAVRLEQDLEAFAHDLHEALVAQIAGTA